MTKRIFILAALVAAILPALFTIEKVGGIQNWQGVMPHGTTDSLYYYARIHEVFDGYPFIGNPYIYEYREEFSPAFFLPDIINAIPLFLGIPFDVTILLNIFLWSFLFLLFTHKLLTLLQVSNRWSLVWSVLLYVSSYSFMLRPTVMQIIFPLFLLFLVIFVQFLYEPHSKKRIILLAAISAITFYTYSYLACTVFFTLFFTFLWFFISKQYDKLRSITVAGVYTTVALIPFALYTFIQASSPLYEETLMRIGLVHTRIPTQEAFFFGRWIIIGFCTMMLLWFFFPRKQQAYIERRVFWISTGCALFVGLFFNVITGLEITHAIHFGRFVVLWMTLLLGVSLSEWYFSSAPKEKKYTLFVHIVIGLFVSLLLIGTLRNIPRALAFFKFDEREPSIAEIQQYAAPLTWLDRNIEKESVIWANISIGDYVPIMTKHYTLFHSVAVLHNISSEELEERYLLWRLLEHENLTIDDVKRDFELHSGAGPFQEQPLAINNYARFCNKLISIVDMEKCPQKTDALTLRGEQYFEDLIAKSEQVKKHKVDLLAKYKTEYVLIDLAHDDFKTEISTSSAVYTDGRFLILPVTSILKNEAD